MNRNARHFNSIVVGVGSMGSATCYQLAKRGRRVLGLEQFDVPHMRGSYHGYTRIIRLAYYEHPSYVILLRRAYELFHDLEKVTGEKVLHYTGSIDAGPADSWVFKGALQSATQFDLPHEVLTGSEMQQRFPAYRFPHDLMGLYQPQGGFLVPERCIVGYAEAAMSLGAEIHGREKVLGYEAEPGGGVRVRTDRDEYTADTLVITAGAWDAALMPQLRGLAVPERQVLAWLQPQRPEHFRPGNFPVFNCLVDEGRFYGFPVHGVPGFKFGKYHHFQETGTPEQLSGDLGQPTERDERMLREFASRYFPEGSGPTMTLAACMFTNTPDGHFIIDQHPQLPQVFYASPCSGHGFKFASVIGEIMADLAERGESRWDINLFRADRFGLPVSEMNRAKSVVQMASLGDRHAPGHGQSLAGSAGRHASPSAEDPRDPRHWTRNAVQSFW